MKASGEYNAATQTGGGSYSTTKTDYQEQRKSTAMGFGMVLIILAIAGYAIYLVWSELKNTGKGIADSISKLNPLSGIEIPKVPSISDYNYYSQRVGGTEATGAAGGLPTYMGVPVEKDTSSAIRQGLDYFAGIGMPIDDPLHNFNSTGSTSNQAMAQKLVNKLNAGTTISKDEVAWTKMFEPSLYNMIVAAQAKGANL